MKYGFVLLLLVAMSGLAQDTTMDRVAAPIPAVDTIAPSVRSARDRLIAFGLRGMSSLLNSPSGAPPRVSTFTTHPVPELPVQESDVIFIGKITDLTPRITPGGEAIYTEYAVSVTSLLLNHTSWKGERVDVIEIGGAVQGSDGRVYRHLVKGIGNQIVPGAEYLFFLKYVEPAQAFRIVKVWQLRNGVAEAMSVDDLGRVHRGLSSIQGLPVADLLIRAKAAVGIQ